MSRVAGAAKVTVTKWGNSAGVRLSKEILNEAHLSEGDALELEVEGPGVIRLRSAQEDLTLEEMVARVTPENRHGEVWWGPARGQEVCES